ncbi:hypothetical protein GOODEAATRI_021592, partial [Goodea atripinnis]
RYMKHKRDDGAEKQDEETVDVTPIMICVFVVMCCNMLVLLYFFYDHLGMTHILYINKGTQRELAKRLKTIWVIGIFCVASSVGLYSCLWPFVRRLPFCKCRWAWVLQDALGIAFCLYMLKTVRLPTFKACTLLLSVLFVYDVFFVFITPFFTKDPLENNFPFFPSY